MRPEKRQRFIPHARPWDSFELLSGIGRKDVALSDEELQPHLNLIEYDMFTEFDSQNFDGFLTKCATRGLVLTPEFMAFRAAWKWDEWNHYLGYRRLVHLLTGAPEEQLHQRAVARPCDFDSLGHLIQDEFSICLVLAYDESVTSFSCAMDFDLFRSFGHEAFLRWIKLVRRDEAWHFWNVMNVIRYRHLGRVSEAEGILETLVAWDLARQPYESTFVLDHDPERFDESVLRGCKQKIMHYLDQWIS